MSNAKFIIGETGGQIDLSISPSIPSAPSSGYVSMWTNGSQIYMVNSSGTNILVGATGAAGQDGATGATGTGGVIANCGSFVSSISQTNAGATAANAVTYNVTEFANGVSIVNNSRITIANTGTYDIQFSFQIQKNSGGDDSIDIWLAKNGSNVADSNTRITLTSNPAYNVAAWNFLVQANAGDYYQIYWSSADTTMQLHATAAGTNPTRPAIPSVILSVAQVTYTQLGPTGAAGTSGTSGISGTSGTSGVSGTSGTSGINGTSGTSGTSGVNGTSGTSGTSGATGPTGPAGSAGLAIKNIQFGGTAGWALGTDPTGTPNSSYYDVTFASSFPNTNYTADFYYYSPNIFGENWRANGVSSDGAILLFSNKTTSGIRIWFSGANIAGNGTANDSWNLRATAIGES